MNIIDEWLEKNGDEEMAKEVKLILSSVGRNEMALPTKECVKDWYREGDMDANFDKQSTEWSNQEVVDEIHKALTYFIKVWQ